MEGRVFINYRRLTNSAIAGRLADRLAQQLGQEHIFFDVSGIAPGVDFVKALDDQTAQCSAFLAVIGPGWTELKDLEGKRRLDLPGDFVRLEIEAALKRDIRVIPVLVDGASMPTADELPDALKPLSRRHAVTLSHNRFGLEVDELSRTLRQLLGLADNKRFSRKSVLGFSFAVVILALTILAALFGSDAGKQMISLVSCSLARSCEEERDEPAGKVTVGTAGWIYVGTRVNNMWQKTTEEGIEPALTLQVDGLPVAGQVYRLISGVNLRVALPVVPPDRSRPPMQDSKGVLVFGSQVKVDSVQSLELTKPTARTWIFAHITYLGGH